MPLSISLPTTVSSERHVLSVGRAPSSKARPPMAALTGSVVVRSEYLFLPRKNKINTDPVRLSYMRHFKTIKIFMLLLLLTSCGVEKKSLALGEYYDAANHFKKAYSQIPVKDRAKRGELALKIARANEKINATPKAIAAYRNAIRYKQASIADHLALGRQLLRNADYKSAAEEFKLVLDSLPDDILAKNGLYSAEHAPQWKKQGSRYTVKRMDVFNSHRDDYSPVLGGDSYDELYFTSTRNDAIGDELSGITGAKAGDIFISRKDEKGGWRKPDF